MKRSRRGLRIFLMFFIFIVMTGLLAGCGGSKVNTTSDSGTKANQPSTGGQNQGGNTGQSSTNDFEKLLTTVDVEGVSGYQGVKTTPYNPQIGAGGNLNFTADGDKLILAVIVSDESMFNSWKKNKDLNAASVPNLGDEAFRGGADSGMYTPNVTFIKGGRSIQLFTFFNLNNDMKPYLNHEQLIKLAKIIEGRM